MSRARYAGIDTEQYEAAVAAYRAHPGDHIYVGHATSLSNAICIRLWDKGLPFKNLRPIKEVLDEEHRLARILRAESLANEKLAQAEATLSNADAQALERMRQAEADVKAKLRELHEKAKIDAVQVMAEEATIVAAARKVALSLHGLAAQVLQKANVSAFANAYVAALQGDLSPREAQSLLRTLSSFGKDLAQLDLDVLDAERKRLGQPTDIVKVEVEHMEKEDALRVIDEAANAAALLREDEDEEPYANGHTNGSGQSH